MNPKMKSTLKGALFLALLGTCGVQIARNATAEPVTRPLAKDEVKAARTAESRVGGEDVKAPLPEFKGRVGGNGVVEPAERETRVAAQVTAVVQKILVAEGAQVKQGDPLVQLSNQVELAALSAAEADLRAERANLERTRRGLRQEDRDAVAAELESARARLELARATQLRTKVLAEQGAMTAEEADKAARQLQAEQAGFNTVEARLRAALAGSRPEDVTVAEARVAGAAARVEQARSNVARLLVKAPHDGEVLALKLREGELYSFQGTEPLLILGDTRTLKVRMDVDERDVGRVALGAEAYVTADAFGATRFAGKVSQLGRRFGRKNIRTDDPLEKNDTKVLEVVITLKDGAGLIPGQRVTSYIAASELAAGAL